MLGKVSGGSAVLPSLAAYFAHKLNPLHFLRTCHSAEGVLAIQKIPPTKAKGTFKRINDKLRELRVTTDNNSRIPTATNREAISRSRRDCAWASNKQDDWLLRPAAPEVPRELRPQMDGPTANCAAPILC